MNINILSIKQIKMFPFIFMSIYFLFTYFVSKYFYGMNKIIGIGTGIILFAFGILIIKLFLFTYGII